MFNCFNACGAKKKTNSEENEPYQPACEETDEGSGGTRHHGREHRHITTDNTTNNSNDDTPIISDQVKTIHLHQEHVFTDPAARSDDQQHRENADINAPEVAACNAVKRQETQEDIASNVTTEHLEDHVTANLPQDQVSSSSGPGGLTLHISVHTYLGASENSSKHEPNEHTDTKNDSKLVYDQEDKSFEQKNTIKKKTESEALDQRTNSDQEKANRRRHCENEREKESKRDAHEHINKQKANCGEPYQFTTDRKNENLSSNSHTQHAYGKAIKASDQEDANLRNEVTADLATEQSRNKTRNAQAGNKDATGLTQHKSFKQADEQNTARPKNENMATDPTTPYSRDQVTSYKYATPHQEKNVINDEGRTNEHLNHLTKSIGKVANAQFVGKENVILREVPSANTFCEVESRFDENKRTSEKNVPRGQHGPRLSAEIPSQHGNDALFSSSRLQGHQISYNTNRKGFGAEAVSAIRMGVTRAAVGRIAQLGDLYDIRSDSFCGINMFSRPPSVSAIRVLSKEQTDVNLLETDELNEKFSQLQVDKELKMSILTGLCQVKGSGLFLLDDKSSARSFKNTICYSYQTEAHQLDVFDEELLDTISTDAFYSENATHIVAEVTLGAHLFISMEFLDQEHLEENKVEELQVQMRELRASIIDGRERKQLCRSLDRHQPSVKLFGDNVTDSYLEGTINVKDILPFVKQSSTTDRAVPVSYIMVSISKFREYASKKQVLEVLTNRLNDTIILRLENAFNEIRKAKERINEIHLDITSTDDQLSASYLQNISKVRTEFHEKENILRSDLKVTLVKFRSGKATEADIHSLLNAFEYSNLCENVAKSSKLELKRFLCKLGIHYMKRSNDVYAKAAENGTSDVYALYSSEALKEQNKELWEKTWVAFTDIIDASVAQASMDGIQDNKIFIFVDQEDSGSIENLSIKHLKDGTILSDDLIAEHVASSELCLAKSFKQVMPFNPKPKNRVHIEFRCPGFFSKTCGEEACTWLCHKCNETLEYGFDSYLYCSCGRAECKYFSFKCSNPMHGICFLAFEPARLERFVKELKPLKELNVLILGETGVGKSTWINGFVNYLTYSTLEEAEEGENVSLIPANFTMTNENYEEITISTGTVANENNTTGQSATQHSQSYVFVRGKSIIRLIDTPGIGDTRGLQKDKENFKNILTHLSRFEEIHGICILLKPNSSRLTVMFQFCIKELLTHLHRDASRNIVFCFTNARSTFYQPGDTLPCLRELLQVNKDVHIPLCKDTIYCVDNESVRFLAALKHGIEFNSNFRQNFEASWNKSVEETDRLIKYIESLEPHKTRNTLSLNEARRIIVAMTQPLAVIGKNINDNIAVVEDKKREIQLSQTSKEELVKKLYVPAIDIEPVELDYPMTVCTSSSCIEVLSVNGRTKTNYVQICHSHCYLKEIEVEQYPCPELMHCWAFKGNGSNCRDCNCKWEKHMHITYECKLIEVRVTDQTVEKLIAGQIDSIKAVEETMVNLNSRIVALKNEKDQVLKVSSKFAHFLKANAITPYNDAIEEYLLMLIQQEKDKIAVGGDRQSLISLQNMLSAYKTEVSVLEGAINSSDEAAGTIEPDEIDRLQQSLYDLPIHGKVFRQFVSVMETGAANNSEYNETRYQQPKPSRGGSTVEIYSTAPEEKHKKFSWLPTFLQ